ncbi:IS4 family transposase [Sulfurospirillum deleyianum]|uniref:Transposase IS4 family protein n=1 Tax=Sulfurospirillum deleyianum (strain ATCC 51133 / DSM 6946 / 5175) TaxID=525898 RepID=D1B0A2_SULD5|nr:transposase [Sulfurospirillum deleyianum]ACZ11719.1 transposase IS4 family protein [Sulfurospirillum deleyianum DSM 6946]ACZ11791.1 transposase IS4 family protein [Sulfurospirillum deleyianum DSM 6946]ACZ11801.1 transposase IS4 family protein [Sulfurospirillum deleyianum DSM 6946]ACZ11969.1 transposase IS4 family protein [Sulfurospirillum deleyianum DSM 6946]ACZ12182.1 transposase IS4 family protein [Sulfurospirillum deleyianum DSM 6946]
MNLQEQILSAINTTLKNPIYQTLQLLNIKSILHRANFVKKREGVAPYLVVLHFVYMLVMNKKISSFMHQSNESFKKDTYYRLLQNSSYNWRKLLSLSTLKIIKLLHKVQDASSIKVFIMDDTVEGKTGKYIEGSRDGLWSNKEKRTIRGINVVSLNYSDGYSNFMIDFAMSMGNYARVKVEEFSTELDIRCNAYKRRMEIMEGKSKIALAMVKRAVHSGIYADYLLVDSWYSKPAFIQEMNDLGLKVISRIANNTKIWNFNDKEKTLNAMYEKHKKLKNAKVGTYGKKIRFSYFSTVVEHKNAGKLKIVFIKTTDNLIPIVSTDLELNDEEIIEIYKRRWDIEQGYKELREYFGFGQEENRIYEALIARMTLSFFAYNIVSYINRISHEPKTIGGLFKDLECELYTLSIAMQAFIEIMDKIAQIDEIVKNNKDFTSIIATLRSATQELLGFRCER